MYEKPTSWLQIVTVSEIQQRADFSTIRYAQCWEDSRLLRWGLLPAGRRCLSIGSAGDNSLALLAAGAAHVTAVEMNPAQVACIELRRAAFLRLEHPELLELLGSRPSARRPDWYAACRGLLPDAARRFWDARPRQVAAGIGGVGKFEGYFRLFRERVLPLAHGRRRVRGLLEPRDAAARERHYAEVWNNWRWRGLFHLFFSRAAMGALGRDAEFFRYVEGSVAARILERTRHALVALDPAENPYLHWILTSTHGAALPEALEEENFGPIRAALAAGRLEVVEDSLEGWLARDGGRYDAFNLSDIFEYMSETGSARLMENLLQVALPGARLAYWNMLVPRQSPRFLTGRVVPLAAEAERLFKEDRAFFYQKFVLEEVAG
jgi:S-adenosylmethionine-diacylglycerol 3-amino-3-carboxypropyl transferase